jgi:predicted MPP superfamily phosphohydrolase
MRFLFLLSFLLFIDVYSFQAIRVIAQQWTVGARTIFYGFFLAISAFSLFFILINEWGLTGYFPKLFLVYGRAFVFVAYISKFLILPFLLIDDVRRGVLWVANKWSTKSTFSPNRMRFLSQLGLGLGSVPFVSLTYGMIANPYRYRIFRETVKIKDLPESLKGLKIVQISDVHSGSFTFKEPVKHAIEMINAEKADLVFFTGDLVNDKADEMDNFLDVFDKITAKHGVYSVLGNHDYGDYVPWKSPEAKSANLDRLKDVHRQLGWNLLLNEHRMLEINNEQIAVIGVENYSAHLRFPKHGKLLEAHQGSEKAKVKLLLSHDPSHWEYQVVPKFKDIDLTFSGHTHGLQFGIEIPGFFKWSPIQYVYKQWAGLYQEENQYLYVNRGLGFLGYPGRVGILPEVTVIELA